MRAAGFILTGGKSTRMGADKALLKLAGKALVGRLAELVEPLVAEVALVGSPERYAHLGFPVLADREPGLGPLGGVVTALGSSPYQWNLILACDLPFMESRFLRFLLGRTEAWGEADAVVPQTSAEEEGSGWRWQPLCAAYHRRCLSVFERTLAGAHPKMELAFAELHVLPIDPSELTQFAFSEQMFKNMNTPADYAEAERIFSGRE
jgi:molybdopterin-guanine dinucleotide biosynthesis protein A